LIEADLSPTSTKKGLTAQQKSVPQLPALFKPKTQKILGGNPNAKNPMSGYMVGSDESVEREEAMLEADMAEDVLARAPSAIQSADVKRKAFKPRDNMLDIMGYASLFGAERQAATRVSL
jgi:hypothetical protein